MVPEEHHEAQGAGEEQRTDQGELYRLQERPSLSTCEPSANMTGKIKLENSKEFQAVVPIFRPANFHFEQEIGCTTNTRADEKHQKGNDWIAFWGTESLMAGI